MASKLLFACLFIASCSLVFAKIFPKQLAGPPSEFSSHQLPNPQDAAQLQQSAFVPMWVTSEDRSFDELPQSVLWSSSIYVDSSELFQFSFLSPIKDQVKLTLTDPNGNIVNLDNAIEGKFPIGEKHVPETSWTFSNPTVGAYTLVAESKEVTLTRDSVTDDSMPIGYVITYNESPLTMVGHLNTYNLLEGQEVGLVAMIIESNENTKSSNFDLNNVKILKDVIVQAYMEVTTPSGTEEDVTMHDDGLHYDGEANDGIYGGFVIAAQTGDYKAQAFLSGKTSTGVSFLRTTQHLIASVTDDVTLTGTATGVMTDSNHITISLDVTSNSKFAKLDKSFSAYAEVYGKDSNGNDVAVCWIGGMTKVEAASSTNVVNLVLDTDWLSYANAKAPLTLKNVVIQEANTFIPVTSFSSIPVSMSAITNAVLLSSSKKVVEITKEMKQGVFPQELKKLQAAGGKSGVILVHGYCSDSNPWSPYPNDWTDAYYFLNPSASVSNDEFAKLIIEFANDNGLTQWSLVGHSQGGTASATVLNYYFSGMDAVGNGRKIQSIGTPYNGCSAAGSAANLGEMFGVGCGSNFDLSIDGSKLWEPSIASDTRSEVYFYTTTYKLGNFFGDYCNMAINMLLEWPNDGTTELDYAPLNGAKNMGNTEKQCHITDMAYPAQYYDHTRNQLMNNAAAR